MSDIELKEISIKINGDVKEILEEVGTQCLNDIVSNSPVGKTGKYRDGWKMEWDGDSVIIFNDGEHRSLSHLIEKGHPTRWGKFAKGKPHILPSFLKAKALYEKKMAEMLKEKI